VNTGRKDRTAVLLPTVFRYKLVAGWWSPMISAGVNLGGTWQPVELFVDSGASYTILRPKVAQELGFDWESGRRIFVRVGDGSLIPVHLHKLEMQIGPTRFKATVGFSDRLGVGFHLLGRQDVFPNFTICFHEHERFVSFVPRTSSAKNR
jgi:predicted aspartyl protease